MGDVVVTGDSPQLRHLSTQTHTMSKAQEKVSSQALVTQAYSVGAPKTVASVTSINFSISA